MSGNYFLDMGYEEQRATLNDDRVSHISEDGHVVYFDKFIDKNTFEGGKYLDGIFHAPDANGNMEKITREDPKPMPSWWSKDKSEMTAEELEQWEIHTGRRRWKKIEKMIVDELNKLKGSK